MEEDIKILEKMFYDDESFEPNNYVEIFFHKEEQEAIKNLIKRNKEIEKENKILKNKNSKCEVTIPPEPKLPTKTICETFSKKGR